MAKSPRQRIRNFYGFEFPEDFFACSEFLQSLPKDLLLDVCDMSLAYPFALAQGKPPVEFPDQPFWEGRYYHDLPEFIHLLQGHTDGLHFGYFFDSPGELPPVIAHYWHSDSFQHTLNGDTLFEALRWQVEKAECDFQEAAERGEEDEEYCDTKLAQTEQLRRLLGSWWGAERQETGTEHMNRYECSKWRVPVACTFDDMGIVVERKLYKPLSVKLDLNSEAVERAAAEAMALVLAGLPGAALKLGRDLWLWASKYPVCYELLDAAYAALKREPLRRLMFEARSWRARCDELILKRGK